MPAKEALEESSEPAEDRIAKGIFEEDTEKICRMATWIFSSSSGGKGDCAIIPRICARIIRRSSSSFAWDKRVSIFSAYQYVMAR